MPIFNVGAAGTTSSGYEIDNSLRFNNSSDDTLTRTQTAGNRKTYTFSVWLKKAKLDSYLNVMGTNSEGEALRIENSGALAFFLRGSGGGYLVSNDLFRDTAAWYHIVAAVDTSQATASNRIKIYVNNRQLTSFSSETYPSLNAEEKINQNGETFYIGNGHAETSSREFDGYMAEAVMIDGQQLTPTSFGEVDSDTGIWKPIDVSGLTFGTNGFYLDFENSGSLGADVSGNGNNFTVNNLTAIDQSTDTCTNNFATLNPLASSIDTTNNVLKEGNLQVDHGDGNYDGGTATFGFLNNMSGKWYWEVRNNASTGSSNQGEFAGIAYIGSASSTVYDDFGTESYLLATTGSNIIYKKDNSAIWTLTSPSGFSAGDIINVALDLDNNKIWFGLNGTFYDMSDGSTDGDPTGSNGATVSRDYDYLPYFRIYGNTAQLDFNFGSPAFSISSGNSDANGYGNFEYAVPSGYYALNTKNLAEYG